MTIRRFAASQTAVLLVLAILLSFWCVSKDDPGAAVPGVLGLLLGGLICFINVAGTATAWPRILEKKSIALPLGIIVSKFALSIGVLYSLTRPSAVDRFDAWVGLKVEALISNLSAPTDSVTLIGFSLGLASILPAALLAAIGEWKQTSTTENGL
jgi:hypothetical protein